MSTETVLETRIVGEVISERGMIEAIVERAIETELVTENVGPIGRKGDKGNPGKDGETVVASTVIFDGGHF